MSILDPTHRRLLVWGSWAQGGLRGYPNMVAFMRITFGKDTTESPWDVLEIDRIVCRADKEQRAILIKQYSHRGSMREKAVQLSMPYTTYRDKLDLARWFVHTELNNRNDHYERGGLVAV